MNGNNFIIIVLLVLLLDYAVSRYSEFEDDTLIGVSSLFDSSEIYSAQSDYAKVFLLLDEGNFQQYHFNEGYLIGYQWKSYVNDEIKIQLYRFNHSEYVNSSEGNYTLLSETDWINSVAGFNSFRFDEALRFDADTENIDYIIGVMSSVGGQFPVMSQYCYDSSTRVLERDIYVHNLPLPGTDVLFSTLNLCTSFSIQGIFAQTSFAGTGSRCTLLAAHNDYETLLGAESLLSTEEFQCWLIRAEKEDELVQLKKRDFDLPGPCSVIKMKFGSYSYLNAAGGVDYKHWGEYCFSDIFEEKTTQSGDPYLYIELHKDASSYYFSNFEFQYKAVDDWAWVFWIIALVIGLIVVLVIIIAVIIIVVVICKSTNKKKVAAQRSGNGTAMAMTTVNGAANYPIQQQNSSYPRQMQVNPSATMVNYGNPQVQNQQMQSYHYQNQPQMAGYQNGGGMQMQQNMTPVGAYQGHQQAGPTNFQQDPPPAYGQVVNAENESVPPPAIYSEPVLTAEKN